MRACACGERTQHQPRLAGKLAVVAEQAFAEQQAVVLEALLRARGAEARRRRIELDLQGGCAHSFGRSERCGKFQISQELTGSVPRLPTASPAALQNLCATLPRFAVPGKLDSRQL